MSSRVVVTDHAFADVTYEEQLAREHGASFSVFACADEQTTAAAVTGADVVLVNFAPITKTVLEQLATGATVVRYGIGYDNVDIEAARDLGIRVANVPDYGVATVADHAAASLLALARRIPVFDRRVRADGWLRPAEIGPVPGFRSMTVGLVGLGRIAREVHARLRPFGFSFIAHDPLVGAEVFDGRGIEPVGRAELAQRAHAISLHTPSVPETYHLVDRGFLASVRRGAVLVNTARGALVDTEALLEAVDDGRLAGVALDVTEPEPPPTDSPLRHRDEIVLTPHAAFYDDDSVHALQRLATEEAGRALRGEPLRCPIT